MKQAGIRSLSAVRTWIAWLVVWLAVWVTAWAAPTENPFPTPHGDIYAQDFVGVLSDSTVARMDRLGAALEAKSGAQIVVAVMPAAPNDDIATYATDLYRHWGIGDKEKNNGVLLLVIPARKEVRVEVGYGLEGALNDAKVGAMLDRYFVPAARQGQWELACLRMYEALSVQTMQEYGLTADDLNANTAQPTERDPATIMWTLLLIVAVVLDMIFNGGRLTRLLIYILASGRVGGGGPRGGGGGSSGGGGAGRSW